MRTNRVEVDGQTRGYCFQPFYGRQTIPNGARLSFADERGGPINPTVYVLRSVCEEGKYAARN